MTILPPPSTAPGHPIRAEASSATADPVAAATDPVLRLQEAGETCGDHG